MSNGLEFSFGVVGLGEVGLRLSLRAVEAGHDVVGVDIDSERVSKLNNGHSYISDVYDQSVRRALESGFTPTTEYNLLSGASHVSVCVPTPLQKSGRPDISYVLKACDRLAAIVSPETTIIIESTVYPGATAGVIAERFTDAGYELGTDLYLTFSPERIDPGNEEYTLRRIPKVIGGVTSAGGDRTEAFYSQLFDTTVRVDGATEAEMTKILENTFRNVNIALVNELVKVADNLGINFWNVIDAAETKPYGFMPFYPGPGLGGHCIPVDPMYLSWRAKQDGVKTPLVDTADQTNREMSRYIVERTSRLLNDVGTPLPQADILVLGVAYKPDVSDTRKSPARDIIQRLASRVESVRYHDPHVPAIDIADAGRYESIPLSETTIASPDCVLLVTDHSEFDLKFVTDHASMVFDTRNATAGYGGEHVHVL